MGCSWEEASDIIYDNGKKMGIPVTAAFELTARCNFHCKMCYLCRFPDDKEVIKQELTAEQWIRIGEEARDAGVFFVTLTGGEIFLRKDFKQIYEAFSNMGFNITLYTNGSMITDEIAAWLGKIPPSKVSITLYGASPETYEKITGHRDGFERTMRGIKALKDNRINTEVKTTVVKANQNEFDAMVQITDKLGISLGVVNYVGPRRDDVCTDPASNRLEPKETALYEIKYEAYRCGTYYQTEETKNKVTADDPSAAKNIDLHTNTSSQLSNNAFKCSAGKCACWFTWDGKMSACGLLPIPVLDVFEKPITELWNELKDKCNEIPKCSDCQNCEIKEFCMACPARLYLETGSFDKKAVYLCKTAQCRVDLNINRKYKRKT